MPHRLARFSRVATLAVACLAAVPVLRLPAFAQFLDDSNPSTYWTLEKQRMDRQRAMRAPPIRQKPTHFISRAAPVRGFARPVEPGQPIEDPNAAPAAADANAAPAQNKPDAKAVIAVLGDTLGQLLSNGLSEAFAERPEIAILRRTKENSGLVREDYYDWAKAARDLLSSGEKIDLAIIMVGSNDRQSLREGTTSLEARSPKWKDLYSARAKALGAIFRERNVPLIWVGLPIMNNERLAADMLDFNEIYKTAAAETGAAYVDTWEAFADDRGHFSAYGPDVSGQMVRLRAGDGVHFTKAGSRKLAHFVEGDIRRILEKTTPSLDPAAFASGTREPAPALDLPALGPLIIEPPVPAPVVRPAAGPILPLTAPPVSPGGKLVTQARPAGDKDAAALIERSLVQGRPQTAQPGRADDFAWPRP